MNKIRLTDLHLKTFTEQDASDYCLLNNININLVEELHLNYNELTDISGIKLFENLEELYLNNNKLTDISIISIIKNLSNIKEFHLADNQIINISSFKYLTKLKYLDLNKNKITDISVIQYLNNLKWLSINYLELESDQIKYINKCKNLETLICINGFKNMSILNQLNKDIIKIK